MSEDTGSMQGKCAPLVGEFTGEAFRRRVSEGNRVSIKSYISAWKIEPAATFAGSPIYAASNWTAYA